MLVINHYICSKTTWINKQKDLFKKLSLTFYFCILFNYEVFNTHSGVSLLQTRLVLVI